MPIVAGGAFAFVIERSVPQLLAVAGEAQIGQALDGVEKIVNARLNVKIETEIFPEFVHLDERAWLRILPVFGFKEIMDDAEIALVANLRPHAEVVQRFGEVSEMKALTVFGQRIGQAGVGI